MVSLCAWGSPRHSNLALKMIHHLLELRGYRVLYGGQQTPVIGMEKLLTAARPDRIYISSTVVEFGMMVPRKFDEIYRLAQDIDARILIGGLGFDQLDYSRLELVKRLHTFEEIYRS